MTNFFDKNSKISKLASIEISKKNTKIVIGAFSVIDDFVKIKCVGGGGDIIIGKYVYINSGTVLYSGNGIEIGDNTLIGPNCSIIPVNHEFKNKKKLIREQGFQGTKNGVKIEDDVWFGANVVILDGAVIRKGSVIGANSLVNSETEAYSINFGSPSRLVGFRK
jgi:acetyltransferase-like isoleucine patch superfamily enzyme